MFKRIQQKMNRRFLNKIRILNQNLPISMIVLKNNSLSDINISTRTIALEIHVCQETIVNALQRLKLMFKFNRWVPQKLTAEDKLKKRKKSIVWFCSKIKGRSTFWTEL